MPPASPEYVDGLVHGDAAPESSWQESVAPGVLSVNAKVADVAVVGLAGLDVITGVPVFPFLARAVPDSRGIASRAGATRATTRAT